MGDLKKVTYPPPPPTERNVDRSNFQISGRASPPGSHDNISDLPLSHIMVSKYAHLTYRN